MPSVLRITQLPGELKQEPGTAVGAGLIRAGGLRPHLAAAEKLFSAALKTCPISRHLAV